MTSLITLVIPFTVDDLLQRSAKPVRVVDHFRTRSSPLAENGRLKPKFSLCRPVAKKQTRLLPFFYWCHLIVNTF